MEGGHGLTSKETGLSGEGVKVLNGLVRRVYYRLHELAAKRGIPIYCHELKDADGQVYYGQIYFSKEIHNRENCFILLNNKNALCQNVHSLGHELGHYMQYKHKYHDTITGLLSKKKGTHLEDDSMEADADRFADKLLVYIARRMIKEGMVI